MAKFLLGALVVCLGMAAYVRTPPAEGMARAANNFLAALTPEQAAQATYEFKHEERYNWHFVPRARNGIPLREMTPAQRHLASALLSAGLSEAGYRKVATIMSLEDILRILEKDDGERRNPEKYYFTIFGRPTAGGTWGYRMEGHHVSLNFTVVAGKVTGSPNFLGANPAEVREGPRKGLRTLPAEEDLARELMQALTAEQKHLAIVSSAAYPDILTGNSRKAALKGRPSGIAASKLTPVQRVLLEAVVREYAGNLPEAVAHARMELYRKAGENLHFAWAGSEDRGGPHYYRIKAPGFLIEYDNTQNRANHIHSVWRDWDGDFGEDLLQAHYRKAAHDQAHGHDHSHAAQR